MGISRREYDNSARIEAARATRARILAAAHELLVRGGFTALTIAALARTAKVSPQTIYNSIGGKAEVLKACYDITLAGDDEPVPLAERPAFRRMFETDDAGTFIDHYASWCRIVYDRVGPLLGAVTQPGVGGDGADEFMNQVEDERRRGTAGAIGAFAERFGLKVGLSLEHAVDAVWALNSPEVYDRLVRRCGWTANAYEEWLAKLLRGVLVAG